MTDPSHTDGPPVSTGWTLAVGVLATVPLVGQLYAVLPLLPAFATEWGGTPAAAAVSGTAFGLAYAAGFLVLGPLSDRFGSRRMASGGVLVTALVTLALTAAPGFGAFLAGRVVQGFVAAAYFPAMLSYVARRVRPAHRLLVTSAVIGSSLSASVLGQIGAQVIEPHLGWRGVFVLSAAALVVAGGALAGTLRAEPTSGPRRSVVEIYRTLPSLLTDRRRVALYLATLTFLGAMVTVYTGLQLVGPGRTGEDDGALLALRASALPVFVAVPVLTGLLSRLPVRARLVGSLLLAAGSAAAAALPWGVAWLAGCLAVLVGAVAVGTPAMITTITGGAPGREGAASSLYTTAIFLGASAGPPLAATLAPAGFSAVCFAAGAVAVVGAGLVVAATRRYGSPTEQRTAA